MEILTSIQDMNWGAFCREVGWWDRGGEESCLAGAIAVELMSSFSPLDFIILAVWAMLALGGVTAQLRRERGEVPFPPHPYRIWKRERERRSTNILDPSHHIPPLRERIHNKLLQIRELFRKEQPAGERTPLLL